MKKPRTNLERIEKLKQAVNLIFEVEDSYPWLDDNKGDIRHDGYRVRIELGNLIQRIKTEGK